jgi:cytochrome c oxidase subunit I
MAYNCRSQKDRHDVSHLIGFFFFIGGVLALVLRTELLTPAQTFIDADVYNQVFTLHGAIMIFFFLVPSVPAALGNFILPLQLGCKDVAFPRINLASYYIYVIGAVFSLIAIFTGGVIPDGPSTRLTVPPPEGT